MPCHAKAWNENSKKDVSVSFWRPYLCPLKGRQHDGISIQISILYLVKRFSEYLAYELSHSPVSWQGFLNIYLLLFPRISGLSVLTGLHFCF